MTSGLGENTYEEFCKKRALENLDRLELIRNKLVTELYYLEEKISVDAVESINYWLDEMFTPIKELRKPYVDWPR